MTTECPFCTTRDGEKLYSVSARQAATAFVIPGVDPGIHAELQEVIRGLWQSDDCLLIRCSNCLGVYAWPHVGGSPRFYELAYARRHGYPKHRWEWDCSLDWLANHPPRLDHALLELGAGNGAFQRMLLTAGFPPDEMYAVEYSPGARQKIADLDSRISLMPGLEHVLAGDTGGIPPLGYVFAFQVLEHVSQPVDYLKAFSKLLVPGGLIFISVPNPARIEFNESHGLLLDMPPNHVSRLTAKAMAALSDRAGLAVESGSSEPFRLADAFREYVAYRYNRRAQDEGTLEAWAQAHLPKRLAQVVGAALGIGPALVNMSGRVDGGTSLYVLRKV